MSWRRLFQLALCLPGLVEAAPWTFSEPATVAGEAGAPHYHHLDSAGRRHVAVSDTAVAVVWEDDSSGAPQTYVAIKPRLAETFPETHQLSSGLEAYEPAVASAGKNQWLAAWEQDGAISARLIDTEGLGPAQTLTAADTRQVTLASNAAGGIAAVWVRARGGNQIVEAAELKIRGRDVALGSPAVAVASVTGDAFQSYPAAAWGRNGRLVVAWEDRRAGHTRLFYTSRGLTETFDREHQLNEHSAPTEDGNEIVGLGTGVMRVMLADDGSGNVRAIWLDKRPPVAGYAVWGARSSDGGRTFGPNEIVQDELGAAIPQWHATLAGGEQGFVAAWDDTRESWDDDNETGDVLVSWNTGNEWSADLLVPGASGEGYQGSPAIALDPLGDVHIIWIERDDLVSPTRLRYTRGVFGPDKH